MGFEEIDVSKECKSKHECNECQVPLPFFDIILMNCDYTATVGGKVISGRAD